MIQKIADNLKIAAINTPMVLMSSFGSISDYDNRPIIKYPYVNIDVVRSSNFNSTKTYTLRVYVCDRNSQYVAFNKCETILDAFLNNIDILQQNYTTNFFTLDFQDNVNGVWSDIELTYAQQLDCLNITDSDTGYILQENGDLIKIEIIE